MTKHEAVVELKKLAIQQEELSQASQALGMAISALDSTEGCDCFQCIFEAQCPTAKIKGCEHCNNFYNCEVCVYIENCEVQ